MAMFRDNSDVLSYLSQGDVWVDISSGKTLALSEMTSGHKHHASRWLMDRAGPILLLIEQTINQQLYRGDPGSFTLWDVLLLMDQNPKKWMKDTELYKALTA